MPQIASFMSRLKISKPTKKTLFMSSIFQILNISKQQHYVFNCVVNNTLQISWKHLGKGRGAEGQKRFPQVALFKFQT